MKTSYCGAAVALLLFALAFCRVHGQGTFQNLDFEAAKIVMVDGTTYNVATSNALPGWSASSVSGSLGVVSYNIFTFIPTVGLYGSNSYAISGNFSVWLSYGGSISQTGLLPETTQSLLLKEGTDPPFFISANLELSFNGAPLPLVIVSNAPNFVLYGADIAAFAGQTGNLTVTGGGLLDDISFSPAVVPEPDAVLLVITGAILFIFHRRKLHSGTYYREIDAVAAP